MADSKGYAGMLALRRDRLDTRLNAGFKLKLAYEIKW